MASSNRDDFSPKVVEILKKRAAYLCSNPDCRKVTVAPSEEADDKVIYIGRAAHICSAAVGGPRYRADMTAEERSDIANGIFLCCGCADMIDDNSGIDFPVQTLIEWKTQHEKWVLQNLNKSIGDQEGSNVVNIASSTNQSGGITANQVNLGSMPRSISSDSEKLFLEEIRQHLPQQSSITIRTYFGDAECANLSIRIKECFERAGWTIKGHSYEIPNIPVVNVGLGVPESEKNSKATLIIYNWLNRSGLKAFAELVPNEKGFIIFVGQNT